MKVVVSRASQVHHMPQAGLPYWLTKWSRKAPAFRHSLGMGT